MWDVDKCIFYGKILECLQRLIEAEDQEKLFLTLTNQYIKISTLTTRSDINYFRDLFDFVGFHIYKKHIRKPGTQTLLRRSGLWLCFSSSFLPSVLFYASILQQFQGHAVSNNGFVTQEEFKVV